MEKLTRGKIILDRAGIYNSFQHMHAEWKDMQRTEWAVKNEVFVKCGEMVLRRASWKLLRGSRLRSSVASASTIIKATRKSKELMGLCIYNKNNKSCQIETLLKVSRTTKLIFIL